MGRALHASSAAIQLTITAFLVGMVVGQVGIGPLSDSLGRRGLLLGGTIGFIACSMLCAVAPSVGVLITARFLQGVAAAAGMVLARAVITDRFHGPDIPRYFALLAQILAVAPAVAPVLGGVIITRSSWRAVFVVLCAFGVLLMIGVLLKVPESLPRQHRQRGGLAGTFRAMGSLFGNRPFLGYALALGFASAALFAYIGGSSFVFQRIHGVSAGIYSVVFAVNAVGILSAGATFSKLARRMRQNALLTGGVAVAAAGTLAQVLITGLLGERFATTWATLFVALWGVGMIIPATMSLGQNLARATPGAASALLGGVQFGLGALATPLVGVFGEHSSMPMALIMLTALALAVLALPALIRPWQGHGEVTGH